MNLSLTDRESIVANDLICPGDIDVTFDDIGGLDEIKQKLYEAVIMPLHFPQMFQRHLHILSWYADHLQGSVVVPPQRDFAVRTSWHWQDNVGKGNRQEQPGCIHKPQSAESDAEVVGRE